MKAALIATTIGSEIVDHTSEWLIILSNFALVIVTLILVRVSNRDRDKEMTTLVKAVLKVEQQIAVDEKTGDKS